MLQANSRDHHQPIRSLPQLQTVFSDNEACVDWEFANKEIKEQYGIDLKYEKEVMQRKLIEGLLSIPFSDMIYQHR